MRIELIAKNYKPSDKLKDIVEKKIEKLSKYFADSTKAKVVMKEINKDKYVMEITIYADGNNIMRSEVVSDNMYDNIDLAIPKLERQIRKYRTRLGKKIKEDAFDEKFIVDADKEEELKVAKLARTKIIELRKISVKEAIDEMELLDHDFYLFINDSNSLVNVVYKRADGDIGLLDLVY